MGMLHHDSKVIQDGNRQTSEKQDGRGCRWEKMFLRRIKIFRDRGSGGKKVMVFITERRWGRMSWIHFGEEGAKFY